MCGRFVSSSTPDKIAEYFGATFYGETLGENYNVAPTNDIYAVVAGPDGARCRRLPSHGLPLTGSESMLAGVSASSRARAPFRHFGRFGWVCWSLVIACSDGGGEGASVASGRCAPAPTTSRVCLPTSSR